MQEYNDREGVMNPRKSLILSAIALVVAVFGSTLLGGTSVSASVGSSGSQGASSDTLSTGKTVRGVFGTMSVATSSTQIAYASISFGYRLSRRPVPHYIKVGTAPKRVCPGNVNSPQAAPGNLCVYEGFSRNTVYAPQLISGDGKGRIEVNPSAKPATSDVGAIVEIFSGSDGNFGVGGTWAVTAP